MVWAHPVVAETNLTPGGHARSSGRIFSGPVLPDGADRLQTECGGRSAASEMGNRVDVDCNRVGAAARRVERGYPRSAEQVQEVGRY